MKFNAIRTRIARSPGIRKCALWITGILHLYGFLGFILVPPILKHVVTGYLGEALRRPVAIHRVGFNPLTLSLTVEGMEIKEREGGEILAGFDGLHLDLQAYSLWRRGLVIDEIRLLNPRLRVVRLAENRYNVSDLADGFMNGPKEGKAGNAALAFSLNNIQVSGGRIEFDDRVTGEKHVASDLALTLPFVSSMAYAADIFVEPHFSAILDGARIELKGQSKPFSEFRESEFRLISNHVALPKYFAHIPAPMPVKLESGALDTDVTLIFDQARGQAPRMTLSGTASIRDLKMSGPDDAPLLAFARLDLALDSVEPFSGRFRIEQATLDSPEITVRSDRAGKIDWLEFLPKTGGAPVDWSLGEGRISGGVLHWSDASFGKIVRLDAGAIEAFVKNLDGTGRTADFGATFTLGHKGEATVGGTLGVAPFDADLDVSVKTVDLMPLRPYFSGKLNFDITRGHVSARGKARLRPLAQQDGPGLTGGFAGHIAIDDFQSVDTASAADFLRWKSLYFDHVDARFGPGSVSIGEIALSDFFARVIVSPEGRLNLLDIVRADDADAPRVAPRTGSRESLPVRIDKVTLQGGRVRFTDNFIKPNYTANLEKIGGQVAGLSSAPESRASLELHGHYDRGAPLAVLARINPLSATPYLDLQADVKGVDLTALSAYSGKYAGYAIDTGKLSLSVRYKMENRKLEAENRLFLDQLTFGEAVESAEATTLPVRLAVSLLKNNKGEIDIHLPISGSLDDPRFSVGAMIVKVLANLLTKAATSPFALLGSMFGNEKFDDLPFEPGYAGLTPEAVEHLEKLAVALADRPGLRLGIEGRADLDWDTDGMKRARLERKLLRVMKGEAAERENEASAPPSEIAEITAQEYSGLLERVYAAEDFPKPRSSLGFVKSLPVEEMEKLILAHSAVGEDDLNALADRRARTVRDWMSARGVDAERIFLLPGKVDLAEEDQPCCGVRFSLSGAGDGSREAESGG
jgi:uncharacterized protein involved in outer membrane biogenesis